MASLDEPHLPPNPVLFGVAAVRVGQVGVRRGPEGIREKLTRVVADREIRTREGDASGAAI